MKKRIALFVVFAMLMSLFAGCSSDGASGNDASTDLPQDEAAEDKIVIGYTVNDLNDTWVSIMLSNGRMNTRMWKSSLAMVNLMCPHKWLS